MQPRLFYNGITSGSLLCQCFDVLWVEELFSFGGVHIGNAVGIGFFNFAAYHLHCAINHLVLFGKWL